jgi:hypothetical protein
VSNMSRGVCRWIVALACLMTPGAGLGAADLPPYFGGVSFSAQPFPWTAEASADFGALLRALGEEAALDQASVRVTGPSGEVLPTRFEPDPDAKDRGLVRWNVPATPGADQPLAFRVHFGPASSRTWKPVNPEGVGPANLLPNAGFEVPDVDEGRKKVRQRALFWQKITPGSERLEDARRAHGGKAAIRLVPHQAGDAAPTAYINTPGDPGIVVEGGRKYRFRYWTRVEGAVKGLVTASQVYWYDAEKKYLPHETLGAAYDGDSAWQETSRVLEAPPTARYAMFYPTFYSAKGVAYLDDFAIAPAQPPHLEAAQSLDGGRRVTLGAVGPHVRRLDFLPEGAAAWPGFQPVAPGTAYTPERGFGWIGETRPAAVLRDLPDDLARSIVRTSPPCTLRIDMPDGEYRAWFLIGDSGLGESIIPTDVDWSIRCAGNDLLRHRPDAKTWYETVMFRNFADWWQPDADVYGRFVAPQYQEHVVPLTVAGGAAVLECAGVPLGALMIVPAGQERALRDDAARLRADRRRGVSVRLVAPPAETPVDVTEDDRRRGYVVFARDLAAPILPGSGPQRGERVTSLVVAATPGEMEPISFAVHPLANLGTVRVTVSDLAASAGRIPATAIDVAVVRYVERVSDPKDYAYEVQPGPIQAHDPSVQRGTTVRWWLRLSVPADAGPGAYSGTIRIQPSSGESLDIPLTVQVLPVRLAATPITAGLYHFDRTYWYVDRWRGCFGRDPWLREATLQHERDDLALLREFGINSLSFCEDNRGMTWDGKEWFFPQDDRFTVWMDLYKEAGMGPMPWYGFAGLTHQYLAGGTYTPGRTLEMFSEEWRRALVSLIDRTKKVVAERGWPEILFYLSDELSNEGPAGGALGRRIVDAVKDIPGIRTVASMNGPPERAMLPGLTIAMPNHAFPLEPESIGEIKRNGCDLWVYNVGNSRAMWGLYLWRVGATGRFQWYHRYTMGEPWNAFDGDNQYSVTWVTPGKPLPTPELWAIREGLDDLRYVKALEDSIARGKASRKPAAVAAAAEGERRLDALRELVPEDARLLVGIIDPREAGRPAVGRLSEWAFLDEQRRGLAEAVIAIESALR